MTLGPVAILGSSDFDVTDIDFTSIRFGPDEAVPAHKAAHVDHLYDVNGDGFDDLVVHFRQPATGLSPGDVDATLVADLLSDPFAEIVGTDLVNIVK